MFLTGLRSTAETGILFSKKELKRGKITRTDRKERLTTAKMNREKSNVWKRGVAIN